MIRGAIIYRDAPPISHFFFADDSIIFGKANEVELLKVKHILKAYERASGQEINLDKFAIAFSAGVAQGKAQSLAACIGARHVEKHDVYLGIPCTVGRSKKEIFQMLEDRVRKKLKDWKRRFLSKAGRTILIKTVAQAIPTYLMSMFLLPETVCRRINSMTSNFLWGQMNDERRIHWCNWRAVCRPKKVGGLGFRDIANFNKALLAKQAWRLLKGRESALARTLRARYYPRINFLDVMIAHNPSYTWRSIMAGKLILKQGLIWRVGDGLHIDVWRDRWVPEVPGGYLFPSGEHRDSTMRVAELFTEEGDAWDVGKIQSLFPSDIGRKILNIPIPLHKGADQLTWKLSKNGVFSVKTGYMMACQLSDHSAGIPTSSSEEAPTWKWINGIKVLPKIHHFLWSCAKGILPVTTELRKRRIPCDVLCRRCGAAEETLEHALRDCKWCGFLWQASPLRLQVNETVRGLSIQEWFKEISKAEEPEVHSLFAVLLWICWKQRNSLIFKHNSIPHHNCIQWAMKLHYEFWSMLPEVSNAQKAIEIETWKKPPFGVWKVNVDAATQLGEGAGLGVVIRTDQGKVIITRCKRVPWISVPEVAEAMACQEGIILARELGGSNIMVETDCQLIQRKLVDTSEDLSYVGGLCQSIRLEASSFETVKFCWVRRNANKTAHSLAHFAISNSDFALYNGAMPSSILPDIPVLERSDFD